MKMGRPRLNKARKTDEVFAKELRQLLKSQNLHPELAAHHLEVSSRTLYRWIAGDVEPPALVKWAVLRRLATQ